MNESSRYAKLGTAEITLQDGRAIAFLRRRWLPQPEELQEISSYSVTEGDRLDNIAAGQLGDPTMFWQLCDANGAMHPRELETIGRRLRVTLPEGIPVGTTLTF